MTSEDGGMMNELQDLVLTRMAALGGDEPLSLRDVVRRSNGLVSIEPVRAIVRGTHSGRISDRTAQGLARALQVPLERIYDAAGLPSPGTRWEWPPRFDRLDAAERQLVEDVAAALLMAREKGRRSATDS